MNNYFRGWRRKAGCVTLVLACLFTAGWIRGLTIQGSLLFVKEQGALMSDLRMTRLSAAARDGLVWSRSESQYDLRWVAGWVPHPLSKGSLTSPTESHRTEKKSVLNWRFELLGIEIGKYRGEGVNGAFTTFAFWRISYWSIVIPLTIL